MTDQPKTAVTRGGRRADLAEVAKLFLKLATEPTAQANTAIKAAVRRPRNLPSVTLTSFPPLRTEAGRTVPRNRTRELPRYSGTRTSRAARDWRRHIAQFFATGRPG